MTAPTPAIASMTLAECHEALARWQVHAAGAVSRTEQRDCRCCIAELTAAIARTEAAISAAPDGADWIGEVHLGLSDEALIANACGPAVAR